MSHRVRSPILRKVGEYTWSLHLIIEEDSNTIDLKIINITSKNGQCFWVFGMWKRKHKEVIKELKGFKTENKAKIQLYKAILESIVTFCVEA